MRNCLVLILFVFVGESVCFSGYYWKDYTGKIPSDAFPAGHDANNQTTYIGLVYLGDEGIIPATIYPGEIVYAPAGDDVVPAQNYVQILCTGSPENLEWIIANKTDFHFITMNKYLVRGGVQDNNWLSIGRVNYQEEVIIGKIMSGRAPINDAFMQYVHNGEVKIAYSYEALTLKEPSRPAALFQIY